MHVGSIRNPGTAAGRVYDVLRSRCGDWLSGWDLTTAARTTAIGTRISEIRAQLPQGQRIEHSPRPSPHYARGSWYRLLLAIEED